MSFPFRSKNLWLNNSKTRTAMNVKISLFVICVETITYSLLHNLHDCTFHVTLGECNVTEGSFFLCGRTDPCNLSSIQLARQLMELNSFICLTYHLSDNLKIHKFSPTTYSNQEFWFLLCYIHSSCCYNPLNKIMCFVLVNST